MAEAYTGRFAPSPTGPLHFGSLVSALASFLDARANHGRWLLRIEDIDPPREVPGAAALIARQLETHGLVWDGAIVYQRQRETCYRDALRRLTATKLLFLCDCTRDQLHRLEGQHAGDCGRRRLADPDADHPGFSIRIHVDAAPAITFRDHLIGRTLAVKPDAAAGDLVLRRRDGHFAYPIAVTVDDAAQGISHVVRGGDLLASTPHQIVLLRALGLPVPIYGHVPVVTDTSGHKLSKQNHAPALDDGCAGTNLYRALVQLGQRPPPDSAGAPVGELLDWACRHWSPQAVWQGGGPNITQSNLNYFHDAKKV